LPKDKKGSERAVNNHIKTTLATTPVSSMVNKEQSFESIAFSNGGFPSIDNNTPSVSRIPSIGMTSQMVSTTNSITPMSIHSKEEFTPMGNKYQSKTKQVNRTISFLRT
jgi:hypothetical protein